METPKPESTHAPEKLTPSCDETIQAVAPEETLPEFTEEEKQQIGARVSHLVTKDSPVQNCFITLVFARQLYYAGLQSLRERLTELGQTPGDGVEQALVGGSSEKAMQPFQRPELVNGIQKHVLPWLAATIASESEEERQKEQAAEKTQDKRRRTLDVNIGFPWGHSDGDELTVMGRDRPLILAGHAKAVGILLEKAVESLKATEHLGPQDPKPKAIRLGLTSGPQNALKVKGGFRFFPVHATRWMNKLNNYTQMRNVLAPILRSMNKMAIDLLIIDDITMVMPPVVSGSSGSRTAGNALRHIRKWAEETGCGVIAGIPLGEGETLPPLGTDKAWEQLELYSDLRGVQVENGPYDPDFECETYTLKIQELVAADMIDRALIDRKKIDI